MFYNLVLTLHSWTRWAVLIVGIWALFEAYRGWFGKRPWTNRARTAGRLFAATLTIQFVLGVLFYIIPGTFVSAQLGDFGAVVRNPPLRFFVLEHTVVMFVALSLSHMAGAIAAKAPSAVARYRRSAIFYTLTMLLILISIPWPFLNNIARPWFRI
jgi:hypothetical protein